MSTHSTHLVRTESGAAILVSIGDPDDDDAVGAAAVAQRALANEPLTVINLTTGVETVVSATDAVDWWA